MGALRIVRTWIGAIALATCCAGTAASTLADRQALPEEREAALAEVRRTGEAKEALDVLAARVADPEERYGERNACISLLRAMGPDARAAVPALLAVLAVEDPDPSEGLARNAADALSRIAPDDETVFVAVRDWRSQFEVELFEGSWAPILARFGERAKPQLLAWFRSDSGPTRMMAVRGLAEAGAWARPYLLEAMNDPEHPVAAPAVDGLVRSGAPAGELLPALFPRLESEDRRVAVSAIDTVGRLGPAASAALPALRSRKTGTDPYFDVVLAHSLFRIAGTVDDDAVSRVAAALASNFVAVHHRAAEALRDFGPRAAQAVPAMAKAARRLERASRATLCDALAATGSKDAIPPLLGVLRGEMDDDARPHDDVVRYDDLAAAIRALVALRADEAVGDIRKIAAWKPEPDDRELRRLVRLADSAVETLGTRPR